MNAQHDNMRIERKKLLALVFVFTLVVFVSCVENQTTKKSAGKVVQAELPDEQKIDSAYYKPPFSLKNPDYINSPHTGMTRDEWIRCGIHILEGAFQYVDDIETPMFLPKFPGKSYPHNGNENATPENRSAAIFEAVARTFNVAAPLLADNPDLTINNIRLIDYYKFQLLELLTNPECDYFIGYPDRPSQQTCELGNLALWNLITPDVFWNRLSDSEKEKVANTMQGWSVSWTNTHNWRFFNVMMMTFLDYYGYEIDKTRMEAHLDNLLIHYAGNGWYRDTGYDYYTIHVFHLYNAVWAEKYGKIKSPERVEIINRHFNEFLEQYPLIFGKQGEVNMYGRSILYRLGASVGLPTAFLNNRSPSILSPGEARRVASAALLQFVTHPSFFHQGIPSLGFYGPFDACIQSYSCSASPYWMFLSFVALTIPENDPFWTEKEEMGHWADIKEDEVHTAYLPGPGMLISNHGSSGASEIRPGKIYKIDPNYSRLVYNTAFPWEADPDDGITSSVVSLLLDGLDDKAKYPSYTDVSGYRDSVFYRQATYQNKRGLPGFIDMASIIIPNGEIRIERVRKIRKSKVFLGHFSMPHMGKTPSISNKEIDGKQCVAVSIPGRQLALTNYLGWQDIGVKEHTGLHPESYKSSLPYTKFEDLKYEYGPVEILISILLHKTDDSEWNDNELQPIEKIEPLKAGHPYHLGGLIITLKNRKQYSIDFRNIDGMSSRH
ncbi:MAG: DUF2264 domain-containing protein [Bacteroidota bacterium]